MSAIYFFYEDTSFKLPTPRKTKDWIKAIIQAECKDLGILNYIFCSDNYLLAINRQYLGHDTFTDIVTFNHAESDGSALEGDIFISVDRVQENAAQLKTPFDEELHRVVAHGVLHLAGHDDKSQGDKAAMRAKEDTYLSLRHTALGA